TRPRARLGQVAPARRGPAHGVGGHQGIGGTVIRPPVAALRDVARTRCGAALGRALRIGRTGGAEPVADLHQVAGTRRVPTERAGIPGRVLARIAAPVADVHRAGIEILRARAARRHLRIDRAVGAGAVAALGCVASAGHAALEPVQVSARSHTPAAARHTVLAGWKTSAGQAALVPSQVSVTSQTPAAARHTVPAAAFASAGQAAALPLQNSAGSHAPAEARHSVVGGWKTSAGQSLVTPSQLSPTSQGPAAARHSAVLFASGGQATLVPVHVSVRSHTPAAARHTVSAGTTPLAGHTFLPPSPRSPPSPTPAA